ncbi:MAG: hypothetical protein J6C98_01825 [Oscillospiraceae bacterium]|nr:hypothetical protein [Oscillospiraceae bacterium]
MQEAEYRNRKERMETGATEGESREARAERKAPERTTARGSRDEGKGKRRG